MPVLGGVVAGMTVTLRRTLPPGETAFGLADIAANNVSPPPLHGAAGVDALRGVDGTADSRSFRLLSVSRQPFSFRFWLLFAPGAAVGAPSTKILFAVPQPTESMIAPVLFSPSRIASPPPPAPIEH